MQDRLFLEYGVEEDDLMRAVVGLQVQKDPEVIQLLKDNMKSLPPEVMQQLTDNVVHCGGGCTDEHHNHEKLGLNEEKVPEI